jgi:hypothetical protein
MKKFSYCFILFLSIIFCSAQHSQTDTGSGQRSLTDTQKIPDFHITTNNYFDSLDRVSMDRNLDAFVQMQKEREKKERQQMYIRIALGIVLLVVLIVGLRRRRKIKG